MLDISLKQKHMRKHMRKESYEYLITCVFQIIIFIVTMESFYLAFFFSSVDTLEKKKQPKPLLLSSDFQGDIT